MSDHRTYYSILTPPTASGDLDITLETLDAETNITFTTTISLTSAMSEVEVAREIEDGLNLSLGTNSASYEGSPAFSDDPYQATFQITRSDHVLCIWSQAQFEITENYISLGGFAKASTSPVWVTIEKAESHNGGCFLGRNGLPMETSMIADYLEGSCAEVASMLKNNIVLSTYLGEYSTKQTQAIFTSPTPGVSIDTPIIKRKYFYENVWTVEYLPISYNWIRRTGRLQYRPDEIFNLIPEAFDLGNEVRVTFIAGYSHIPVEIQRAAVTYAVSQIANPAGVAELKGGSFSVKFHTSKEQLYQWFLPIKKYRPR